MKLSEMTKEEIIKVIGYQTIGLFVENDDIIKTIWKSTNDNAMKMLDIFNFGVLIGIRSEREK